MRTSNGRISSGAAGPPSPMPPRSPRLGPARTALAPGELLPGGTVPPQPAGRVGSAYLRLDYRAAMEIAVVGAAVLVALDADGRCTEAPIPLTAAGPPA